jgi:Protein of unknown function (DUF3892)
MSYPSTSGQATAAKWADYCILEVRYNAQHCHIDRVRLCPDLGASFGSIAEHPRLDVVDAIRRGVTFMTIVRDPSDGKYRKGQPVRIVLVNGREYIKTVDNGREADNLENLPEF